MLLSAVSVLVVAQSSSEIPEGLTNNPVYICHRLQNMSDLLVTGLISGEIRSGLTPSKPQRSSSIRDATAEGPKRRVASQNDDSGYESVELNNGKPLLVRKQVIMSLLSGPGCSVTLCDHGALTRPFLYPPVALGC